MSSAAERWQRIEALFHDALEQPAQARDAFVAAAAGSDHELLDAVRRLLRADSAGADPLLDGGVAKLLPAVDPLVGQRFGAFRAVAHVADGGMGSVYRAERVGGDFQQTAAVKVLRLGLGSVALRERFVRERQALARLVHPHVTRLLDGGTTEAGLPFLVMEFVDGAPIDRSCDLRRLPVAARLSLFVDVCRAVHFAHQNLVLHLDLKPGNVLVDARGAPRLVDFGVAGLLAGIDGASGGADATRSRPLTPEYTSPELLQGEAPSTAADVYSLGVLLYELLSGARPFPPATTPATRLQHVLAADPPRPSSRVAGADAAARAQVRGTTPHLLERALRGDLDRIVLQAMHRDPRARYPSAEALAEDVERHLAGFPVRARAQHVGYRVACFVRRNRWLVLASTAALVALVAGVITSSRFAWVASRERDAAAQARRVAEDEAAHARIEAASSGLIGAFLRDTFLSSQFLESPDMRDAALATIARRAAQLRRQHTGEPHLLANVLDALGQACLNLDALDQAESLVLEALELRRAHFGEHGIEHALSLGSLGTLRFRQGRLAEAQQALGRAHALHVGLPPGVHTDVGRAANDLAAVERALGNRERARELHEQALAVRRRGSDPAPVAESLNNLANSERDPARQRALLDEALALRSALFGPDDPATLQAIANLAALDLDQGDFAGAAARLEEVVARCRPLRALGHEQLAASSRALAYARLGIGAVEGARAAIDEALALDRRRFGDGHLRVAADLEVLAMVEGRQGDGAGAVATLREVLTIRTRQLPDGHAQRVAAQQALGVALVRAGELPSGVEQLRAALAGVGSDASREVDIRLHLAHGLERSGDAGGAEQQLLDAFARCEGDATVRARRSQVARYLEAFYRRSGREADAERFAAIAADRG